MPDYSGKSDSSGLGKLHVFGDLLKLYTLPVPAHATIIQVGELYEELQSLECQMLTLYASYILAHSGFYIEPWASEGYVEIAGEADYTTKYQDDDWLQAAISRYFDPGVMTSLDFEWEMDYENEQKERLRVIFARGFITTIILRAEITLDEAENLLKKFDKSCTNYVLARAPTPEELSKWISVADLRGKVAMSFIALGGFRPITLSKLQHHHVKQDLEKGLTSVHIHVEERITKGQYGDYDTFIGKEAVDCLRAYLNYRRRGSPCEKIPPEEIHDQSPILRAFKRKVEPLTVTSIKRTITSDLLKSGLVKKGPKRRELRPYSLRKYFHTNLAAAGVHRDYIDYFMGHVTPTYNSIKSKCVEFLRRIYISSGLSIRPKTHRTRMEILKENG